MNKRSSIYSLPIIHYSLYFGAVREGFEPSVQLPVRQFSKLFLSASQAPHPILGRQR